MNKILSMIISLALFAGYASAGGEGWISDFEAAKKQAAKENKDILIDFTGSDWCGWCIKLRDEVFSKEHFKTEAPKKFVLLEIDFPRDKSKLTEKVIKQNDIMAKEFDIKGYPTIILANAKGEPYASTGYQEGGPEKYIEHLNNFHSQNAAFKKLIDQAEKVKTKAEKATLIDKAISLLGESDISKYYSKYPEMIIELDADNSLKLKNKYLLRKELPELFKLQDEPEKFAARADELIQELKLEGEELEFINDSKTEMQIQAKIKGLMSFQEEPEKLLKGIDDIIKDLKLEGKYKQQMITQKAMINLHLQDDMDAAIVNIDKAIEVDPDSTDAKMLKEFRSKIVEQKNSSDQEG